MEVKGSVQDDSKVNPRPLVKDSWVELVPVIS